MDQILKMLTPEQVFFLAAVGLILIGIVAPKKFFGIEVDWTGGKSALVLLLGISIFAFGVWRNVTASNPTAISADDDTRPPPVVYPTQ
jgi:hypothetical protein